MFMQTGHSMQMMTGMQNLSLNGNIQANSEVPLPPDTSNSKNNELKIYVDLKFQAMEHKIHQRLDNMERLQNEKLDRILELLGTSAIKDSEA